MGRSTRRMRRRKEGEDDWRREKKRFLVRLAVRLATLSTQTSKGRADASAAPTAKLEARDRATRAGLMWVSSNDVPGNYDGEGEGR